MPLSVTKGKVQPDEHEPKTVNVVWSPKEDITAYELSQLLRYALNTQPMFEEHWNKLGDMQRHFIHLEKKQ